MPGHTVLAGVGNMSERKAEDGDFRQAKEAAAVANRAESELLATTAHELRTHLSVILGYTTLLALAPDQRRTIQRIEVSARELLDLVSAGPDVNRLQADHFPIQRGEVNVAHMLKQVKTETRAVRKQSRLSFVWQIDGGLPPLYTDAGKLKLIITNLITNAVQFTPKGSVTITARARDNGVEVTVCDTGVGIPPDALPRIFEPCRLGDPSASGQQKGKGLGLPVVKRLLALLGGMITVESEVGRGSTFRVWLPRMRG
jgi:signal transduction histidine kinase